MCTLFKLNMHVFKLKIHFVSRIQIAILKQISIHNVLISIYTAIKVSLISDY